MEPVPPAITEPKGHLRQRKWRFAGFLPTGLVSCHQRAIDRKQLPVPDDWKW